MDKPRIVSGQEWQQARDELLTAEKQATRTLDAIAAAPAAPAAPGTRAESSGDSHRRHC